MPYWGPKQMTFRISVVFLEIIMPAPLTTTWLFLPKIIKPIPGNGTILKAGKQHTAKIERREQARFKSSLTPWFQSMTTTTNMGIKDLKQAWVACIVGLLPTTVIRLGLQPALWIKEQLKFQAQVLVNPAWLSALLTEINNTFCVLASLVKWKVIWTYTWCKIILLGEPFQI